MSFVFLVGICLGAGGVARLLDTFEGLVMGTASFSCIYTSEQLKELEAYN